MRGACRAVAQFIAGVKYSTFEQDKLIVLRSSASS
jgi:hypothetical protein